jgi:putative radical SAM enzyme (TIGR03279 family)
VGKAKPLSYGVISTVDPDSLAEISGIQPGDEIVSINGCAIRDIIDFRYHASDTSLEIRLQRGGADLSVIIEKDYDDPLGLDFTTELFDGVKICRNRCTFCFVDNLPRGMRRTLYVKDDDYRLSFLHGNFVTFSNVSDDDVERILEQRLSPMYVSVHATRPELRGKLLRPRGCPDILSTLRTLAEGHIQLHTQIVLCPGVNDGENLDRTIEDLAGLGYSLLSIGVVPVGLTRYSKAEDLGVHSSEGANAVLKQVNRWQRRFRKEIGTRLVFASDELYLRAGLDVPGAATYEGYPQYENGIGIVRSFIDEARYAARRLPVVTKPIRAGLITGKSAEPFLRMLADRLNEAPNISVDVYPIVNDFFGRTVTVAGLLTGQDVVLQLKGRDLPDVLFVPRVMLREGSFLDDVKLSDVADALGCEVVSIEPSPRALADAISALIATSH